MVLVLLGVLAGWLVPSSALGFTGRQVIDTFAASGGPEGVAVENFTGDVYVAEESADIVQKLDASGDPLGQISGAATPAGSFFFEYVAHIAVDNSGGAAAGDLYVVDSGHNVIDRFDNSGAYLGQIAASGPVGCGPAGSACATPFSKLQGATVDSLGNVWVQDAAGDVFEFDSAGNELASWSTGFALAPAIAVDSAENVYVLNQKHRPVEKFSAAGVDLGPLDEGFGLVDVAIDATNGHILVDHKASKIDEFESSGTMLAETHVSESGSERGALAVNGVTSHAYLVDGYNGVAYILGPFVTLPDARTEQASGVQPASAVVHGTVNPSGQQVTDCHFEYGATSAYGQSIPCSQSPASIGSGTSEVPVSAEVTGLEPDTEYHFRLVASDEQGTMQGADQSFTTTGPPRECAQAVNNIAQTSATLDMEINPHGFETTYHYEYGTSTAYGSRAPASDNNAGAGTTCQEAPVEVSGLQAGVTYHYRVVAVNAQGTYTGNDHTFMTEPAARIEEVSASEVSASDVTFNAQIDPLGNDTTYQFQWGTDTSYGHDVPLQPTDIGAGSEGVSVSQHLSGLLPNITYHYRVVAHNSLGTAMSSDHTFVYDTNGFRLPDNRAYEMVTPPHKNAAVINDTFAAPQPDIAEGGSRVTFISIQCFAGAESCVAARALEGEPYLTTRSPAGWTTLALAPPASRFEINTELLTSAETGAALFSMPTPPMNEDDFYVREPDGSFVDIGPTTPPSAGALNVLPWVSNAVKATSDFSHVVYQITIAHYSTARWPFDSGSYLSTYEYVGSGNRTPILVGVSGGPGSHDLISACGTELGAGSSNTSPGALSADGSIVYFKALPCAAGTGANVNRPVPAHELYARIDQARTVRISERSPADCTSIACRTAQPGDARFIHASDDGSKVFFTSTQQLTDNASEDGQSGDTANGVDACTATRGPNGCNLYEYDFANPAGHELIDASAGDTSGHGPRVQGVMAVSSDGSHAYFVARGVLSGTPNLQGEMAEDGADNMYVFERDARYPTGHTAFIAKLSTMDLEEWRNETVGEVNVTPDGRFVVFVSRGDLTPDDTRHDNAQQVFRYDAQTGQLIRISIGNDGFNDNGNRFGGTVCIPRNVCPDNAKIVAAIFGQQHGGPARSDPTMSHDGAYVFFESPVGLTPQALDNVQIGTVGQGSPLYAENVYEWHDGHVYLISDGKDTAKITSGPALGLTGSDATGANFFFRTVEPLVAQDTDTQLDYYDARICTASDPCVSQPPPPLPPCLGEACHGTPAGTPPLPGAPTVTFNGQGNVNGSPPAAKPKQKKATGKKRSRCAKGKRRRRGGCARRARRTGKARSHKGGK